MSAEAEKCVSAAVDAPPLPASLGARSVDEETRRRLADAFPVYASVGLSPFGPSGVLLPSDAGPFLERYYSTPVEPGDLWIVTLPKCGTTWTQEMVWLIQNDCDYEGAQCLLCPDRYHFLEIPALMAPHVRDEIRQGKNPVSKRLMFSPIEERPKPWFVKTHLPLHYCPPALLERGKVIYVARNPKDVCVSYFNHLLMFKERRPDMNMDEFAQMFMDGEVSLLPFFPHVLEAWKERNNPNMLFLFFEDMKRDLRGAIQRVADFLEKPLTEKQLDGLESHLHFSSMKKNPWVNKNMTYAYSALTAEELAAENAASKLEFMRKGETGDWRNHFSQKTSDEMDAWIERELAGTDLKFVTELKKN
ncbi:sulfotransferase 1C4-like [Amphibalanus amphitrite]|uniref:sulfotransferase 1C4-like n=1 Tax=Amphibalanus amphitrite TaxID=1232801 RepID=UPI001C8FBF1B|nr:sulfotransferase 1C4-like [Amphibalanus amphitrite]